MRPFLADITKRYYILPSENTIFRLVLNASLSLKSVLFNHFFSICLFGKKNYVPFKVYMTPKALISALCNLS